MNIKKCEVDGKDNGAWREGNGNTILEKWGWFSFFFGVRVIRYLLFIIKIKIIKM